MISLPSSLLLAVLSGFLCSCNNIAGFNWIQPDSSKQSELTCEEGLPYNNRTILGDTVFSVNSVHILTNIVM